MVARTTHNEPASPGVKVEPVTEQVPETTVHDTEPVPEPPVLVIDSVWPYVAEVDDTESAACEVRLMVMAVSAEFTAL